MALNSQFIAHTPIEIPNLRGLNLTLIRLFPYPYLDRNT